MTSTKQTGQSRTAQAVLRHWREAVPNDRLAHLVRDAARGLTRSLQYRLSDHNVLFGHWVFLRILWEEEGLTQRALSERAGLMESTTHTAILKMEALGYIKRKRQPDNRRKLSVHLTRKGHALKDQLVPLAERVNEIAVSGISAKDIATTRRTLLAMVANLAQDETQILDSDS